MSMMPKLAMLGLILLVLGLYWLPSILAYLRRRADLVPIVVVNALLGWTVVGWLWAVARLIRGHVGDALAPQAATAAAGRQDGRPQPAASPRP